MKPGFWKRLGTVRGLIVSLVAFGAIFVLIYGLTGDFETRSSENQLNIVRDAVKRATLTCYAVEGYYPQTINHLKENYGLAYDTERYMVSYDAFASNIMPSIRVIAREAKDE